MTNLESIEIVFGRPALRAIVVIVCIGLAAWGAYPHMGESIWQDEAATLAFHVSRGVVDPFLHYVSPNSHVGFTAMLAGWLKLFPNGVDLYSLRLLPFLLFIAAVPATYAAAFRLGGPLCAAVAGVAFATSPVSSNFATQLRGYGPSWAFMALALFSALAIRKDGGRKVGLAVYLGSCWAAVAVLPTNVYFLLIIGCSVALPMVFSKQPIRSRRETAIILLAMPVLALLLAYAAIWRELMGFSGVRFSDWARTDLAIQWLRGSLANLLWLTPLAVAGMISLFASRKESVGPIDRTQGMTASLLAAGILAFVAVVPNPPFPRTLAPYLPVWICSFAFLLVSALRLRVGSRAARYSAAGGAITALALALSPSVRGCGDGALTNGKTDYDLCHQYFRDSYHPEAVLDAWAAQKVQLPIASDFEGYLALGILRSPARIFEYRSYPTNGPVPLVVAHDETELSKMARHIGADPSRYHLIADTGYFKLYGQPLP